MMKKILVSSTNPVKAQAALLGFQRMFPDETFSVQTVGVPSGVSAQPMDSRETYQGALNRAQSARERVPMSDFVVGIEGGVEEDDHGLGTFAWVVILGNGRVGKARSGTFYVPDGVAQLVRQGVELGEADDRFFKRSNSKQGDGAIGILTGDVIDRTALYEHAVILALTAFKNPDLYLPEEKD